jgi:ParB family chromosome partitioning protein
MRRMTSGNVDDSMGVGRPIVHGAPPVGGPSTPARWQGVSKSRNAAEIPVDRIGPDPDQPREEFDEDALGRLSESILTKGLLQPISVRWAEGQGRYVIIAGERRWRAATMAGLQSMSCVVVDRPIPPGELLALQCVENLLREDLRPIEQARAFRTLMDVNGWSGNQLAKELGVSQPAVVAALKLLSLPEPVQDWVESGELPASSASAIASLEAPEAQSEVAARVVAEGLSRAETVEAVRQVASRAKRAGDSKGRGAKGRPKLPTSRVIRTAVGPRLTVEYRKGLDGPTLLASLREAVAKIEAEQGDDQVAA